MLHGTLHLCVSAIHTIENPFFHKDIHIITIAVSRFLILIDGILVDDLKTDIMDVLLIYQGSILGGTIISLQYLNIVYMNLPCFLHSYHLHWKCCQKKNDSIHHLKTDTCLVLSASFEGYLSNQSQYG